MNLTKMNLIASHYYKCQRRREKREEARRRKRRCPPAPPPSPASPPPPPPRSPSLPLPRSRITACVKSRISARAKSPTVALAPAQSQPPVPAPLRSQAPAPEPPPSIVKRKTARVRAYTFNSSDSDYSPNADHDKSDSDFSTPRKRIKLFSDADEIRILKGLLYMNKNDDKKTSVTDEVAEHINKSLRRRNAEFTKTQFRSKIRGMKDKYNKNRDKEGKFYKLCARIWGDKKEQEKPMNSSSPLVPRVLFENESHDSCVADTNLDNLYVEDSYVEDSYSENNDEHHDNEEGNNLIARRVEMKRKFKELDTMTLEISLKRVALMKETIEAVLEVIQ